MVPHGRTSLTVQLDVVVTFRWDLLYEERLCASTPNYRVRNTCMIENIYEQQRKGHIWPYIKDECSYVKRESRISIPHFIVRDGCI